MHTLHVLSTMHTVHVHRGLCTLHYALYTCTICCSCCKTNDTGLAQMAGRSRRNSSNLNDEWMQLTKIFQTSCKQKSTNLQYRGNLEFFRPGNQKLNECFQEWYQTEWTHRREREDVYDEFERKYWVFTQPFFFVIVFVVEFETFRCSDFSIQPTFQLKSVCDIRFKQFLIHLIQLFLLKILWQEWSSLIYFFLY